MSAIRKAARGEECTLNIAGVCSYDPDTVVLCHFPSDSHGIGFNQPPSGGCELKHEHCPHSAGFINQPPSGGCELKRELECK